MSLTFSCNSKVYECSAYTSENVEPNNWACGTDNHINCSEAGDSDIAGIGVNTPAISILMVN